MSETDYLPVFLQFSFFNTYLQINSSFGAFEFKNGLKVKYQKFLKLSAKMNHNTFQNLFFLFVFGLVSSSVRQYIVSSRD